MGSKDTALRTLQKESRTCWKIVDDGTKGNKKRGEAKEMLTFQKEERIYWENYVDNRTAWTKKKYMGSKDEVVRTFQKERTCWKIVDDGTAGRKKKEAEKEVRERNQERRDKS